MVIEDARDFYERAVVDFIKHDDADSAADLYFAVLNLNEHGHTVHVDDEQTLLRAHSILIDNGVDDNLLKSNIRRLKGTKPLYDDPYRQGSKTHRHTVYPSPEADTQLKPATITLANGQEIPIDRDVWNSVGDEKQQDLLVDRLFSHRPYSSRRGQGEREQGGVLLGRPQSHGEVGHVMEHLDIFPNYLQERSTSGLERLTRALYGDNESEYHVSNVDKKRKKIESRFDKDSGHRRDANLGDYDEDSINQEELFNIGLEDWKQKWSDRFQTSDIPPENRFIDHIVLRNEGIPEERIWNECYDKDTGNFLPKGYEKLHEKQSARGEVDLNENQKEGENHWGHSPTFWG